MSKRTDDNDYQTLILGGGGAGRTAAAIVDLCGKGAIAFLEDNAKSDMVNGFRVVGKTADRYKFKSGKFIVCFGMRYMRERIELFRSMCLEGFSFENAFFPGVYIDKSATLGVGNVIAAGCKILPNASVGNCCFMCVTSSVDHDCQVADGVYLAPGATLCGGAVIEEGAFIGANATILPEIRVGKYAVIGAGAVVSRDVAPGSTVIGVPGHPT